MQFKHSILFCFFIIITISCKTRYYPATISKNTYSVSSKSCDSITSTTHLFYNKSDIETYLQPLHHSLEKTMNQVIGSATAPFKKDKIENSLGYLITDAMLFEAQKINPSTTMSIYNFGGIRANHLAEGNITLGNIYEILPFENTLVIVSLKGSDLKKWCNVIAKKGGWPVSGFSFTIKKEEAVNLEWIDDNTVYTIATNDYIAAGNDGCDFLKTTKPQINLQTIRDVVINYIKKTKTISPDNTARIIFEK